MERLKSVLRRWNNVLYSSRRAVPSRPFVEVDFVRKHLQEQKVFGAGKIGTAELLALEFHDRRFRWPLFAIGWRRPAERLANNAGFFPVRKDAFAAWDKEMRGAITCMDFLCAWQLDPFLRGYEDTLIARLAPSSKAISLEPLGKGLWPQLQNHRWLVISPFVRTMQAQLQKLSRVHEAQEKLSWDRIAARGSFLECPLHWHLCPSPYASWSEGLEKLAESAVRLDFEVALIGAGAWSLPLAARIKGAGRSAIHTGGETQLLFGIKGKRWDEYGFYNSAWVSLPQHEAPTGRKKIDNGCYW